MIQEPDKIIQRAVEKMYHWFHDLGFKTLRQPRKLLVFLDDENFIEIEPVHVCIPCEHDMKKRGELEALSRVEAKQ